MGWCAKEEDEEGEETKRDGGMEMEASDRACRTLFIRLTSEVCLQCAVCKWAVCDPGAVPLKAARWAIKGAAVVFLSAQPISQRGGRMTDEVDRQTHTH